MRKCSSSWDACARNTPRASKAFEIEVIPAARSPKGKATLAQDIVWKNRDAYENQDKLDGCYLLRTDREDLSDAEIWETYVILTRIETAFRALDRAEHNHGVYLSVLMSACIRRIGG